MRDDLRPGTEHAKAVHDAFQEVGFTRDEAIALTCSVVLGQHMPQPPHLMDMQEMLRGVLREQSAEDD